MDESSPKKSCMDTAYVRENPPPKIALQGSVPPF